ncbi:serine hydrolase domain-containing protein [Marinimicrobium alkaliphilum]|uniref:serine hydrolase domain-containing protein n=1 Tax=Marinimicrobium alkaliphilum TaxID=2202654 RepID=UPI000DBAABFF|nr:serine hydrolase [Marinimicrobium alkaliphilum]
MTPFVIRRYLVLFLCVLPFPAQAEETPWQDAFSADAEQLTRLRSVIIAHQGEPVFERVFRGPGLSDPVNIKSLSKTVLAALVGAAIDRGLIDSVDQPVVDLLGDRVPDNATEGVEQITVGHLLSLQAGLERTSGRNYGRWVVSDNWVEHILTRPFVDEPGGRMLYSSGSTHLLSAVLTEASGKSTLALAREWLGEPLNIAIPAWPQDPQGIYFGGNDMRLSPRALLVFGEMVRRQGRHGERQVLSADWVAESWQGRGRSAFTGDPYGYGWFALELAGERAYYGRGFGGQVLYVLPDLGVTAVFTADPEPPSPGSRYLRQIHGLLASHVIPALRAD